MRGGELFSVGDRLTAIRFGPISARHVEAFARVSGDRNAIHLDPATAREAGLAAPPVHGMQLVALMHRAVAVRLSNAEVTALSTRFLAPVPVGDTVEVTGRIVKAPREPGEAAVLRLFLHRADGTLACLGEATLVPAPAEMALP
jgi:acyl dehydratase